MSNPTIFKRFVFYIFFILAVLFFQACKEKQAKTPAPVKTYPVVEVSKIDVIGYTSFPVSIEGRINNDVQAKISGYIKEVLVDEGASVHKGQILFRLETNSLDQSANAARSNVSASKSAIAAAQAAVDAAQLEVNKLRPLVDKKIISNMQLQTAEANLSSAKARLAQAQAGSLQAQADFRGITENINYSTIRSPINGVVGKIPFRIGSLVGPSDQTPMTTVSEINEVYAYFSMNEKDYFDFLTKTKGSSLAAKLKNLPPVELILANGDIYAHKGRIEAATGQIDPGTGTISFRAVFPNPERLLSNGNSGIIRIPRKINNVLAIPETATFEQQGVVNVFKVAKDTVATAIIKVSERVNNLAIVPTGLQEGDIIIANGIGGLKNGDKIKPQIVSFDSITTTIKPVF